MAATVSRPSQSNQPINRLGLNAFVQEVGKGRKPRPGKPGEEEAHGILEGISSLHSWIKTQTMIRPTKLGKKKDDMSFDDDDDEDVVISLCSKDPQACKGVVRFDYTNGEYVPVKLA